MTVFISFSAAKARTTKKKLHNVPKMRTGSFSSIVSDYETQVSKLHDEIHEEEGRSTKCQDLSNYVPEAPQYQGTYSKVSPDMSRTDVRFRKEKKGSKRMMTFSEFMKNK